MRNILSVLLIVFASWATAQSYPEPSELAVNDFAGIMDDSAEKRVSEKLDALRKETGVEMVVLTLSRQDMFAPDISLKKFARGIFNEWGIGDKKLDDGVLVLVLRDDQAIRIALGKGLGGKADKASDKAVERSFLPEFREERYEAGIEKGVDDLIENLVRPYVAKRDKKAGDTTASADSAGTEETVPATAESAGTEEVTTEGAGDSEGKGGASASWLLYVLGGVVALIAVFKVKGRMQKCPECGQTGLKTESKTVEEATETSTGKGERITSCGKCGYRNVESYEIAKRSKSEPEAKKEEFSGGKAGKGGATGKW